jgi:hypothetical protein
MTEDDASQVPIESATSPVTGAVPAEPETAPPALESHEPTQTAQIPVNEPLPQAPATAPQSQSGRDLLVKARATIQDRKHKKLEKVLEFLNTKGKITNDEVEKLLHVSDATATRYLSALEKQVKIKQIGKTGKAVTYTKP